MNDLVVNNVKVNLVAHNGSVFANSLDVASVFEKPHKDILTKIRSFSERVGRNFSLKSYLSLNNKDIPMYEMNRDGFIFLVTGFNGEKVEDWKLDLIDGINVMEASLRELTKPMSQLEMIIANAQASLEQNARINILEVRQEEILELTVKAIEEIKNNGDVLPSIGFVSLKTFNEQSNMSIDFIRAMIKCGKYNIACEHDRKHTTDLGRVQNYTAYKLSDLKEACIDVDSKAQWTTDKHSWKFSTIVGRQYMPRNKK